MSRRDYILTLLRTRGATPAIELVAFLNRGGIATNRVELYADLVALEAAGRAKVQLASDTFYGPRKWALAGVGK